MQAEVLSALILPGILFAFLVFGFPVLWMGIVSASSWLSGYGKLAERFPGARQAPDRCWTHRSASFGLARYKNTLTVGVSPEGLYLWVMFLFRYRHPPILVPWDQVEVEHRHSSLWPIPFVEITFPSLPGQRIRLSGEAGKAVAEAKHQASSVF